MSGQEIIFQLTIILQFIKYSYKLLELVSWKWTISNEKLYYNQTYICKYYWKSIIVKDRPYPVSGMLTKGNYSKLR